MGIDQFGITEIYPSTSNKQWYCNWSNGVQRTINSAGVSRRNKDPYDPMLDLHCLSYSQEGNQLIIYGNGQAKLRGKHPRIYVNNPDWKPLWLNVEMTCYAKFTKPIVQSGSYTTFRLAARSNHQASYMCQCNGKGYAHEMFINQSNLTTKDSRFRKELIHPHYANYKTAVPSGIPVFNQWIGMKFICKTDQNNNVVQQSFIDLTNGLNGGNWKQIGLFIDNGSNWAITESKELANISSDISRCTSNCVDTKPRPPYNEKILRPGASCYLRTDFIYDSYFSRFSIREI